MHEDDRVDVAHRVDEASRVLEISDSDLHVGKRVPGPPRVAGERDRGQPTRACGGGDVPTGPSGRPRDEDAVDAGVGHRCGLLSAGDSRAAHAPMC